MSDPVTALSSAHAEGGIAIITEAPLQGMITLRCDPGAKSAKTVVKEVTGQDVPTPGSCHIEGARGVAWMSPDELLLLCPYDSVAEGLSAIEKALADSHALAVNVSDARASFLVSGAAAREVLAKLCPVDLAPGTFEPGMFRRTRMAQVAAAFWMRDAETFQVICFRSQAQYVFDLLKVAAQPGSVVHHFTA